MNNRKNGGTRTKRESLTLAPPRSGRPLMDSLPNELLTGIFEFGQHSGDRNCRIPFPVLVSHVSQRWRDVALAYTLLWTDIRLSLGRRADLWLLFLQRSGTCPLDVLFHSGPLMNHRHDEAALAGGLDILLTHLSRCRTLTIVTDRDEVLHEVKRTLTRAVAPLLRMFELHHFSHHSWSEPSPVSIFPGCAPQLRTVRLKNVAWDWRDTGLDTLTSLDLTVPYGHDHLALPLDDFRSILAGAPRLAVLALGSAPILIQGGGHQPIRLPAVRTLQLALTPNMAYGASLCALLDVPVLESLTISQNLSGFVSALYATRRGYPNVRTLKLERIERQDLDLLNAIFLEAFPAVHELTLVSFDTQLILELLLTAARDDLPGTCRERSESEEQVFWPHLRSITLEKWPIYDLVSPHLLTARQPRFSDAETDALYAIAEVRGTSRGALGTLRLQRSAFSPEFLDALSLLVKVEKLRELEPLREEYHV